MYMLSLYLQSQQDLVLIYILKSADYKCYNGAIW